MLEYSIVDLKPAWTDRLETEDKVKQFRRKLFYLCCTFEIFRLRILVAGGGERWRGPVTEHIYNFATVMNHNM